MARSKTAKKQKGELHVYHVGWFIFVCILAVCAGWLAFLFVQISHVLEAAIIGVAMLICVLLTASVTFVRGEPSEDVKDDDVKLETGKTPLVESSGAMACNGESVGQGVVRVYDDSVVIGNSSDDETFTPAQITVHQFTEFGDVCLEVAEGGEPVIYEITVMPRIKAQALMSALIRVGAVDDTQE